MRVVRTYRVEALKAEDLANLHAMGYGEMAPHLMEAMTRSLDVGDGKDLFLCRDGEGELEWVSESYLASDDAVVFGPVAWRGEETDISFFL